MMKAQDNPQLQQLFADWKQAKFDEANAVHHRRTIEKTIKAFMQSMGCWVDDRTQTLFKVKIDSTHTRSWDQDYLGAIANTFPESMFPFKAKWFERRGDTRYMANNDPELWKQLEPALTIKPKINPTFTMLKEDY